MILCGIGLPEVPQGFLDLRAFEGWRLYLSLPGTLSLLLTIMSHTSSFGCFSYPRPLAWVDVVVSIWKIES